MEWAIIALLLLQLALVTGVGIFFLLGLIGAIITPVPFVPTPRAVSRVAIDLLDVQPGEEVYDLGCGNGRLVYMIADKHPEAQVYGAEIAPLPYLLSQMIVWVKPRKNGRVLFKDFNALSLTKTNKVFLYLLPEIMNQLLPKLERELPKGARLVACDFEFANKQPVSSVHAKSPLGIHTLRIYEF